MAKKKAKLTRKERAMKKQKENPGNYLFVGALLLALGIGMYFGRPDVGVLTGLGAGFLLLAIYYWLKKK
jgi:hypothetical protein